MTTTAAAEARSAGVNGTTPRGAGEGGWIDPDKVAACARHFANLGFAGLKLEPFPLMTS